MRLYPSSPHCTRKLASTSDCSTRSHILGSRFQSRWACSIRSRKPGISINSLLTRFSRLGVGLISFLRRLIQQFADHGLRRARIVIYGLNRLLYASRRWGPQSETNIVVGFSYPIDILVGIAWLVFIPFSMPRA